MPDDRELDDDTAPDDDDEEIVDAELVDDDRGDDEMPDGIEGLLGALGDVDMSSLLGSAMQMQQQMMAAQQEAAESEVEGQSGGGVVKVVTTGAFDFRRVEIAQEAVDPDDVEMLQDLVLAAIRDAVARVTNLTQTTIGLGGMGMGGMGGAGMDLSGLLGGLEEQGDDDGERDP